MKSSVFKIDSDVRQGYVMSPWFFIVSMDEVMKMKTEEMERNFQRKVEKKHCLGSCM